MSPGLLRKDLVVLVADKSIEASVEGLLSRPQALGIRPVTYDLYVHPERDPGCLRRGHDFLRIFARQHYHALILFDQEGCGWEDVDRSVLESDLERRLVETGWEDRAAAAIVIAPELENWVWADSPRVDRILGWQRTDLSLRDWLRQGGLWEGNAAKPSKPKDAVELTLKTVRKPKSSAIYSELARTVSTDRCTDPAFEKLRRCLREWFSAET